MKTFKTLMLIAVSVLLVSSCTSKKEKMNKDLKAFIAHHDSVIIPLYKQAAIAAWDASISGKPEDYQKSEDLNMKMMAFYADKESLKKLEVIKVSGLISDSLLSRELDVLYRSFIMAKADTAKLNKMIRMQSAIEQKYSNFRTEVRGKKLSDNDVEDVLRTSKDIIYQKEVWEAQKKIGPLVADDLKKLVKVRNEVAHDLGFRNYHEMSLTLGDQDPRDVGKLFEELDSLTKKAFAEAKGEIDDYFVKYYNLFAVTSVSPSSISVIKSYAEFQQWMNDAVAKIAKEKAFAAKAKQKPAQLGTVPPKPATIAPAAPQPAPLLTTQPAATPVKLSSRLQSLLSWLERLFTGSKR